MAVYLLRYDAHAGDLSRPRCSARYYLGYAADQRLPTRIHEHRTGRSGAALPTWMYQQDIGFVVVRVWWGGDRSLERRLKRSGNYDRYDPATPLGLRRLRSSRTTLQPLDLLDQ